MGTKDTAHEIGEGDEGSAVERTKYEHLIQENAIDLAIPVRERHRME
jgi:hypothetical protein